MSLKGKNILVTGGTGSFGSAFVRHALACLEPSRVVVFSRDELKQYEMRLGGLDDPRLRWFLGDVRDRDRLRRAFAGVDCVIHAAAMKQVPACEYNPLEAMRTNINGTSNVIEAALDNGVPRTLLVSTDKACEPVNLYGATKMVAEKLFVQSNAYRGTSGASFSVVRYGNVMGSRGSVIPLFLDQARTGTITITDMRMTRFWITLPQAATFVASCLGEMRGGEIFVPRLPGAAVADIAEAIDETCQLREIGPRNGEKIHETLITAAEMSRTIRRGDHYVILPENDVRPAETRTGAGGAGTAGKGLDSGSAGLLPVQDLRALLREHGFLPERRGARRPGDTDTAATQAMTAGTA